MQDDTCPAQRPKSLGPPPPIPVPTAVDSFAAHSPKRCPEEAAWACTPPGGTRPSVEPSLKESSSLPARAQPEVHAQFCMFFGERSHFSPSSLPIEAEPSSAPGPVHTWVMRTGCSQSIKACAQPTFQAYSTRLHPCGAPAKVLMPSYIPLLSLA